MYRQHGQKSQLRVLHQHLAPPSSSAPPCSASALASCKSQAPLQGSTSLFSSFHSRPRFVQDKTRFPLKYYSQAFPIHSLPFPRPFWHQPGKWKTVKGIIKYWFNWVDHLKRIIFDRTLTNLVLPCLSLSDFAFALTELILIQGVFLHWASPKKLKYGKPRLGESTLA